MTIEDEEFEDSYFDEEELPDNHFLVMWCSEGLECIVPIDVTKLSEGADMLAMLEDRENDYGKEMGRLLWMLKIRAQTNSQRNYEIYKLVCSGEITQENLESMFEQNPQNAADLLRSKGVKLYGERLGKKKQVII